MVIVGTTRVELHSFSDATLGAYGCCWQLVCQIANNSFVISLLTSKSRVSSIKPFSIPKLGLQGAVFLAKLISQVQKEFFAAHWGVIYSLLVSVWNGKRPDTFVRRRVDEFQKLVGVDYWHHVESKLNPDLLFRGHLFSEILHYDFEDNHLFS